jgi:outer membrane protein, heavy metal efflux system
MTLLYGYTLRAGVLLCVLFFSGCVQRTQSPLWEKTELQQALRDVRQVTSTNTQHALTRREKLALSSPNSATPPSEDAATGLSEILRMAAERSPMVEAARRRWTGSTYKRAQVVSLPDPKLEYKYYVRQMAREEEKWELGISQEIPYPGKLIIGGKLADKESEIAYLRYQVAVRNSIAEAKEIYCELYYIDRAQKVTAEIEKLYARYSALATGGTEVAKPKLPEKFRAESQQAQLGYDLILLREMRMAELARLRAAVGSRPDWQPAATTELAEPPESIGTLESLQDQAERFNQELSAAGLEVERAEFQTKLARRAPIPDLMIGASYMRTGDMGSGPDPTRDPITVGVGVSVPLWFGKYKAMLSEAKEMEKAAHAEKDAQALQLRANLARAYFSLNNSLRLVRLYRDNLIPQSRQALQSAEELYRKGNASLASVLETTSTVHNFELARLRALTDFYQNVARIERVIGTAIELRPPQAAPATIPSRQQEVTR